MSFAPPAGNVTVAWAMSHGDEQRALLTTLLDLVAGDYLELFAAQSSNNCDLGSATAAKATRLTAIGPLPPS